MPIVKLERTLRRTEAIVTVAALATIILLVFVAAIARKLNHPLVWAGDTAQLLFVWTAFIGADLTFQQGRHIGVDFVVRRLPVRARWVIELITYALIIAFLVPVGVTGFHLGIADYARRYSGLQISYSWATFSAPVGCLLLTRTALIALVTHLRKGPAASAEPHAG